MQVLLLGGVPDPVVRLNATSSGRVCSLISTVACANETVIGFAGWRLLPDGPVVRGNALVDREIMGSPSFLALSPNVRAHVASEANRLASCAASPLPLPAERVADDKCRDDAPIYGPDDPKEVTYSPGTDDEGCFQTMQSDNNCYNYGTDILTNSFAQPGRGTGVCGHHDRPCVPNTCADVRRAAESDGLVWKGTTLPSALPAVGHYVSLHIWPESNFHWLRQDANLTWSHKPGGSRVRNVDNNNKIITDPAKADVSPWSTHCGYLLATPSKVTPY